MKRRSDKKKKFIIILFLLFSIGFAILTANLNIHGIFSLGNKKFNVHIDNIYYYEDNVGENGLLSGNGTILEFNSVFTNPGDKYEFLMDVVNEGNVDAQVNLDFNGLTEEQQKYIKTSITYRDGTNFVQNTFLEKESTIRLDIKVYYSIDELSNEDLLTSKDDISLSIKVKADSELNNPYHKDNIYLYDIMHSKSVADNIKSTKVSNTRGINYEEDSSNTNGEGVYYLADTKNDKYPVTFFRGDVSDNNVLFANYCWKIVRTTKTGGIKLIYNGMPDSNGYCNSTNEASTIGKSIYNIEKTSVTSAGWMYDGNVYSYEQGNTYFYNMYAQKTTLGNVVVGNNPTYRDGRYYLENETIIEDSNNQYITLYEMWDRGFDCLYFESDNYSKLYYKLSGLDAEFVFFYEFSNGMTVDDIYEYLENGQRTEDSEIKKYVENWYQNNLIGFNNYIDDEKWCNNIEVLDGLKIGYQSGNLKAGLFFEREMNLYGAVYHPEFPPTYKIDLGCSDSNTYSVSNQKNNYPIGLLTTDEFVMASKHNGYLNIEAESWLMTPRRYEYAGTKFVMNIRLINKNSNFSTAQDVDYEAYVRPSISLVENISIVSGNGTLTSPYTLDIED